MNKLIYKMKIYLNREPLDGDAPVNDAGDADAATVSSSDSGSSPNPLHAFVCALMASLSEKQAPLYTQHIKLSLSSLGRQLWERSSSLW